MQSRCLLLCTYEFVFSQGDLCEGDIHDCLSSPCINGGTCVEHTDGRTGYQCLCADTYVGLHCQWDSDGCDHQPCNNDGTCVMLDNGELQSV